MRRVLLIALLCAAPAVAESFSSAPTDGSCGGTGTCDPLIFYTPERVNGTSTGTVNFSSHFTSVNPPTTNRTVDFVISQCTGLGTGCTLICSPATATWSHTAGPHGNGDDQTVTASCAGGAVTAGNYLKFTVQAQVPGTGVDPFDYTFDLTVTTTTTMLFCPTAGAACACGGICNNATCGTKASVAGTNTCACNCNVSGCTSLSIAGPILSCLDVHDGTHVDCSWNTLPGATNYTLVRQGFGTVYSSASPQSYRDTTPGVGSWTYDVHGTGSCTDPAGLGSTLASKDSQLGVAGAVTTLPTIAIYPAGSNSSGSLTPFYLCDLKAPIAITFGAPGTSQVIAATASKKVYVCGYHFETSASATLKFVEGTGSSCTSPADVTGAASIAQWGAVVMALSPYAVAFTNTAGSTLCLNSSAAATVGGWISYTTQP